MTLEQENAELKAHINSLHESLNSLINEWNKPSYEGWLNDYHALIENVTDALSSTPTQSLVEHDKKVIAEFRAKCEVVAREALYKNKTIVLVWDENELDPDNAEIWGDYDLTPLYTLPPIDNEEK